MPPVSNKNYPLNAVTDLGLGDARTPTIDADTEDERKRRLAQSQQQQLLASQNSLAATSLLGPLS